jgi:hypothetical protein
VSERKKNPARAREMLVARERFNRHLAPPSIAIDASISLDLSETADWPADRARALLEGVGKVIAASSLFLALASPLAAQEAGPVEQSPDVLAESEPPRLTDYLAPAAWCPLRRGDPEPGAFGCDGGIAANLVDHSWERFTLAGVAFVGAETVGAGIAGCRGRLCVGAGVAATRDDFGIDLDSAAPVIGATFSLGGLRE